MTTGRAKIGTRLAALAICALFFAYPPARADDATCDKATNQNELNACAQDNYAAADRTLNETYHSLTARLDAAGKARLISDERGWIARRDGECKAEAAQNEGGSIYPLVYFGCLTEKTKARTKELQAYPR